MKGIVAEGAFSISCRDMLRIMFAPGLHHLALLFLLSTVSAFSSAPGSCTPTGRNNLPCELSFRLQPGDMKESGSAYRDDVLTVEFRSSRATTYLTHAFADDRLTLRVRFTPIEVGAWTYRVSSSIQRLNDQQGNFNVADSPNTTGMVGVANLRHFWTTGKKPHLWFAAQVPFLALDQPQFESWLDARKSDGFTHIQGVILSAGATPPALGSNGEPNSAYFTALDERVTAAASRGFTIDLALADAATVQSFFLKARDQLDPLVRYLCARYSGLNVTWQGMADFEKVAGARGLLRDIATLLKKYDTFQHPRSTGAHDSSSPLLADGWMNYLIEGSGDPQLGAVEHQFTQQPAIHMVQATDPERFRHEIWNAATNGEYVSVPYAALQNEANVKAARTWFRVMADTRHWEFEPYFDVNGARAVGLNEVEYLAYAEKPGIVEIQLPKHKYNPVWVNPATGEELPLKDYRGEVFSRQTPENSHDWLLTVPRDGEKGNLAKYYYFESQEPPVQEIESDPAKAPFEMTKPVGDAISLSDPIAFSVKITRANRASRSMQYVWWGETVQGGEGPRLLGLGPSGSSTGLGAITADAPNLNIRLEAINANGKAYEVDKVFELKP